MLSGRETMQDKKLEERFTGCLLGGAIGDAFGMPTECLNKEELQKRYGGPVTGFVKPIAPHPNEHLKAGQYTDDTQQMLIVAESLAACHGLDINDLGKRLGEWGKKNLTDKNYERFPGDTSIHAAARLAQGINPNEAGSRFTTSCGSAMRAAPIGLYFHQNLERAAEYARLSSIPTHNTPECKEGAAMVALITAHLLHEADPRDAVSKSLQYTTHQELKKKTQTAIDISKTEPDNAMKILGTSSGVLDVVPFATYSFLHSPDNFLQVIITAANAVPGDTDSFACIAGNFAGAYLGIRAIPAKFQMHVENYGKIKRAAESLYWQHGSKV